MGARILFFPACLLLAGSCFAQVTGRISGSVTDSSGAAISDAVVNLLLAFAPFIVSINQGKTRQTGSAISERYRITSIRNLRPYS